MITLPYCFLNTEVRNILKSNWQRWQNNRNWRSGSTAGAAGGSGGFRAASGRCGLVIPKIFFKLKMFNFTRSARTSISTAGCYSTATQSVQLHTTASDTTAFG